MKKSDESNIFLIFSQCPFLCIFVIELTKKNQFLQENFERKRMIY